MMEYKGYVAKVVFDDDEELFFGEVINARDTITFHGNSVEELHREMKESVDFYLEMCEKKGLEPAKPFSGKFMIRLGPETHRSVFMAAKKSGKSLNRWVVETLEKAASS